MNINSVEPAPKPDTQHLRTLANGAIYDTRLKRIVANPGGGKYAFTAETSKAMHASKQEKKRQTLMRAANAVAAQGGSVDGHELSGDMAFIEAIGEAMAMKALSVNDPKAVDAARFLLTETGLAEKQLQAEDTGSKLSVIADVVGALASFAVSVVGGVGVVDGDVVSVDE